MVVPLREQGHGGMEGAKVLVEPVVFVVAAELCEAVGDDGFLSVTTFRQTPPSGSFNSRSTGQSA
jgi:hypothetical protein